MSIRLVKPEELADLRRIEVEAGRLFADIGMPEVAGDEGAPIEVLRQYADAGRAWVAVDEQDQPIGYLIAEPVDGCLHIEQISMVASHARRGIGRSLIEHVALGAKERAFPALTLTTFVEVPWNGPYYQRCGFRYLQSAEVTPGLAAIRAHEADLGLDRWPRACMRRDLH